MEHHTAGDPITGLKWSRRTTEKVAMALDDFGVSVSPNTVARLLHQMGYSLRVNHKKLSTDFSPDRNDQFLYLSDLRQRFHPGCNPGSNHRRVPDGLDDSSISEQLAQHFDYLCLNPAFHPLFDRRAEFAWGDD